MIMLKFIKTIHYGSNKSLSFSNSRFIPNYQMISLCSSTASASQPKQTDKENLEKTEPSEEPRNKPPSSSFTMTNFAFENIKNDLLNDKSIEISSTLTVEDLLKISENQSLSNKSSLLITKTLQRWIAEKKIVTADYENDPRFKKLLQKGPKTKRPNTVPPIQTLLYSSDVEKMVDTSNLSPAQCVQLLNGLAMKHSRVKPLIQCLLSVIEKNIDNYSFKETADIFFSMASLSFPHDKVLQKMCAKVTKGVDKIQQSPIIGSIVTSIGILRYRNEELMNKISHWIVQHKKIVRTRDACSFLLTLAFLGLKPSNFDVFIQELIMPLNITDMTNSLEWIDLVWALSVLDKVTPKHLESVLNDQFINSLPIDQETPFTKILKIQNINSVAKLLIPDYKGPFLTFSSPLLISPRERNREKQTLIRAITDALVNLFPSRDFFDINFMDDAGLIIDIIFYYNQKKGPITVTEGSMDEKAIRIVVMANTFRDNCIGEKSLTGSAQLHDRLLQAQKYRIIHISHDEFRSTDKLLKRITYMNDRIKSIVK